MPDLEADVHTESAALALDAKEETPAKPAEQNPTGETAKPEEGDNGKKKTHWAQERIDRLTRQKHDAIREADFYRQQLEARRSLETPAKSNATADDPEPDIKDFAEKPISEYLAAVRAWDRKQVLKQFEDKFTERQKAEQQQTQSKTLADKWEQNETTFASEHDDYAEVFADAQAAMRQHSNPTLQAVATAIGKSDIGPALVYHLGQHPEEIARLSKLDSEDALLELGAIRKELKAVIAKQEPETPAKETDAKAEVEEKPVSQPKPQFKPTPLVKKASVAPDDGRPKDEDPPDVWVRKYNVLMDKHRSGR